MCNFKHVDEESKVQSIPESGTGWKVFWEIDNELCSMCLRDSYKWTGGRIKWNEDIYRGDGFCFFKSKAAATKCLKLWMTRVYDSSRKHVIKKITYSGGLQSHLEDNLIKTNVFRISLCKEFEIL